MLLASLVITAASCGPFEPCHRLGGVNADFQRESRVAIDALQETHRITRKCIGMVDLKLLNDFSDDFTLSRLAAPWRSRSANPLADHHQAGNRPSRS